jgi:hypothetical protein
MSTTPKPGLIEYMVGQLDRFNMGPDCEGSRLKIDGAEHSRRENILEGSCSVSKF